MDPKFVAVLSAFLALSLFGCIQPAPAAPEATSTPTPMLSPTPVLAPPSPSPSPTPTPAATPTVVSPSPTPALAPAPTPLPPVPAPNFTPRYLKGLVVYAPLVSNFTLLAQKAKELNANIISIFQETSPEHGVESPKSTAESKARDAALINALHENGLLVQYMPPCYFNESKAREAVLPEYLECVAEFARFAAERGVYHFTLHHELDAFLPGDDPGSNAFMEKTAREALKEIRRYYAGKVGIGFCCVRDEYFDYDFSGFDYYMGMFYAGSEYGSIENFTQKAKQDVSSWVKRVQNLAAKNKISRVILGETGVCDPNKKDPEGRSECFYMRTVHCTPKEEALYYKTIFEYTRGALDGYFIGYEVSVMGVKGEPAEELVKEEYAKIG